MALLWNADLETGDTSQFGDFEWGGTFDGVPPLSDRVTVDTVIDGYTPAEGNYFMSVEVHPGDQYGGSTGWRTLARQASPIPFRNAGYDSTFVWCSLFPPGWVFDANPWLAGMEVHHTGGSVAPCHFIVYSNYMYVDLFGGNDANKTIYMQQQILNNYQHGVWYVFVCRYKHNVAPNGVYQLWYGKLGTDTTMHQLIDLSGVGTMYVGFTNYFLFGHYRAQSGSSVTKMYMDGMREYSTSAEALSYATGILTGSAPPPDPTPQPSDSPVVTGSTLVGSTLSCSQGTWDFVPSSFAYQWNRESPPGSNTYIDIPGATTSTYTTTNDDLNRKISCDVTAT